MGFSHSKSITMVTSRLLLACGLFAVVAADFVGHNHNNQLSRRGRQEEPVQGGIDFSGCVEDGETGLCCVEKEETVDSLKKDPILECTHKNVEQCHYTYVTQFTPAQQEVCEENFEKTCSITFKQQAYNETVKKCYIPIEKVCNGQGEEQCTTVYESACITKYVEKSPGKFVADTNCEKLPTELCGAGCTYEEGPQECHDKTVTSLVDVPEEVCDLNPQKTCRYATKLVPRLKPKHECTIIPKETCTLKFTTPKQVKKPLLTKWCLDPEEPAPGESYEEENAFAPVLSSGSAPQSYGVPAPAQPPSRYGAPASSAPGGYGGPTGASAPGGYGAPTGASASGGYDAPPVSADGGYGAPPTSAAGGYGAPPASAPGGYGAPPSAAPGGYGAPPDAYDDYDYEASGPASDTYAAYDDAFQSPSAQSSDIYSEGYDAPGPAAGGYNAPSSQAAGGYNAPSLGQDYQSSRTGRTFKRPQTSALPRRRFRG